MFETFEHTADLGLRVEAADLPELFSEAARGLLAMLAVEPQQVRGAEQRAFTIEADSLDYLLFDWLSELLYAYDDEHWLFSQYEVRIHGEGPYELTAVCRGEPLDRDRHALDHEVKAITYHGLLVEPLTNGWRAELIVDI